MRHLKKIQKINKNRAQRRALLRNLATNLVLRGAIKTTLARAKALRSVIEKEITRAKRGGDSLATRRTLLGYFYNETAVNKLLQDLRVKYTSRPGGYTRIIKLNKRRGDNAALALIEFV